MSSVLWCGPSLSSPPSFLIAREIWGGLYFSSFFFFKLLCFWFHSWGFDGAGLVRLCLPSGPEGDPQPGRAWGQTFSQSAPWVSLGYCWDCAGGSKGFFEIDQQETHWRKCCHSPRGGSNWPPPPAGCEIRGGPAPSSQDGKLHAPWSLLLGRRASVIARPLDTGSNAFG